MSSERVTNIIYIDGNGVVGNNPDNPYPDIVMDLDRYRIGSRTPDFPSEPATITEPPLVSPGYEPPLPSVTDSLPDKGEIAPAVTSPEKPKKVHWVTQALRDYKETKNTIPLEVLQVLENKNNPIIRASLFRRNQRGEDILSLLGVIRTPKPAETDNYWSGPPSSDQVVEQNQVDRNYAAGWMRIAGVLEFIGEAALPSKARQVIYELYESGELPYYIAMDTEQNHYQVSSEEFLKRIEPYLKPYGVEILPEKLEILFEKNPDYQKRYGNIAHTIPDLYAEGRLPSNFIILPLHEFYTEEFDALVSVGMRNHDIDNFDYINRANRRMSQISPDEKEQIFQILSNDPQYHINDSYFVRQKRIERAFNKVKGPLLEKVRLGVVDLINRRSTSRQYDLIEAAQ